MPTGIIIGFIVFMVLLGIGVNLGCHSRILEEDRDFINRRPGILRAMYAFILLIPFAVAILALILAIVGELVVAIRDIYRGEQK